MTTTKQIDDKREDCMPQSDPWSIRYLIRRDMEEVLQIEKDSFGCPWSIDDFLGALRQRNCIGMVAINGHGKIVGFMICTLEKWLGTGPGTGNTYLSLISLAVSPKWRYCGIGRQFLETLARKMTQQRHTHCQIIVAERNVPAQLWLRECGINAVAVDRDHFRNGNDSQDGYVFEMYPAR